MGDVDWPGPRQLSILTRPQRMAWKGQRHLTSPGRVQEVTPASRSEKEEEVGRDQAFFSPPCRTHTERGPQGPWEGLDSHLKGPSLAALAPQLTHLGRPRCRGLSSRDLAVRGSRAQGHSAPVR